MYDLGYECREEVNQRCHNTSLSNGGGDHSVVTPPQPPLANVLERPMLQAHVWIRNGNHDRYTMFIIPRKTESDVVSDEKKVEFHLVMDTVGAVFGGVGVPKTARLAVSVCNTNLEIIIEKCGCVVSLTTDFVHANGRQMISLTGPDFPPPVVCHVTMPCPNRIPTLSSPKQSYCICACPVRTWNSTWLIPRTTGSTIPSISSSSSSSLSSPSLLSSYARTHISAICVSSVFLHTHYVQSSLRHAEMHEQKRAQS
jgi:hypothetical protein